MRGVMASGGIGDLIISLPLLARLQDELGRFTIYTNYPNVYEFFTHKVAHPIMAREEMMHPLRKWDFLIHVTNFSWFLRCKTKGTHMRLFHMNDAFIGEHGMKNYIDFHPHYDGEAADQFMKKGFNRLSLSQAMMGYEPMPLIQKRITPLKFWIRDYISVHCGVGENHAGLVTRATKTWDITHFETLIQMIKKKYPKLGIVQLGSPLTGHKLRGVDVCFFNLDIKDSFRILAGSKLHIDGDSGLTHAATSFGVKCIALFGPTPAEYFGHPQNINISYPLSCSPCWWSTDTWVAQCPAGYQVPLCMNMIFPERVFNEVEKAL